MSVPQQKFRELVFQLLYCQDLGKADPADMVPLMMKELSVTKKVVMQAQERVEAITKQRRDIDAMIKRTSRSYDLDRIQRVELNVLRLGVFELFYDDAIPGKVAIAEAMRLSRKFGTPASASFVNAILDHLYRNSLGDAVDDVAVEESIQVLEASEQAAREAAEAEVMEGDSSDQESCEEQEY